MFLDYSWVSQVVLFSDVFWLSVVGSARNPAIGFSVVSSASFELEGSEIGSGSWLVNPVVGIRFD